MAVADSAAALATLTSLTGIVVLAGAVCGVVLAVGGLLSSWLSKRRKTLSVVDEPAGFPDVPERTAGSARRATRVTRRAASVAGSRDARVNVAPAGRGHNLTAAARDRIVFLAWEAARSGDERLAASAQAVLGDISRAERIRSGIGREIARRDRLESPPPPSEPPPGFPSESQEAGASQFPAPLHFSAYGGSGSTVRNPYLDYLGGPGIAGQDHGIIVAIDGHGFAAKAEVGRKVARQLGMRSLDTAFMIGAVGAWMQAARTPLHGSMIIEPADYSNLGLPPVDANTDPDAPSVSVGPAVMTDPSLGLWFDVPARYVETIMHVSNRLVAEQQHIIERTITAGQGIVVTGSDIGTVVAPDAQVKVYLHAGAGEMSELPKQVRGPSAVPRPPAHIARPVLPERFLERVRAAAAAEVAKGEAVIEQTTTRQYLPSERTRRTPPPTPPDSGSSLSEQAQRQAEVVAARTLREQVRWAASVVQMDVTTMSEDELVANIVDLILQQTGVRAPSRSGR